ncbi:MAG: hypothetical protein GY869_16010, partial [Planctomycetes bacterium]|nr:hypothetical protein [Planctomycetota bacterium]
MITTYKLKALLVLLSGLLLFPHILQAAQKIDPSQPAGWSRTGGYVSGTPSSNTEVTWTFSVNESGEYILIFASPNNSWGEFDLSLGYTQISSINQEHLNSKSRASSGHDDFVVLGFSGENGSNPSAFTLANGAAYTIRATNITSANSSHPRVGSLYIAKKTVQPDVLYFNQNYYHSAYTVKTESGDYSLASAGGLEGGSCGTQSTAMLLN